MHARPATHRQPSQAGWFNATKGHGFIASEDGSKVHLSAVERAGLGTLREARRLTYEVRPGRDGRTAAEELSATDQAGAGGHPDCG